MSDKENLKEYLKKAHEQVKAEAESLMTPEEKALNLAAKNLLLLERDLKAAGQSQTTDLRVSRLLEAIEKEHF